MNIPVLSRTLPRLRSTALVLVLAFAALMSRAVPASAATISPGGPPVIGERIAGDFKFTDGNPADTRKGVFVTTITRTAGNNRVTEQTVYTVSGSGETSTEATLTTANDDGSKTVNFTRTPFGSATSFHSVRNVVKVKGGHAGVGAFTALDGSTGTFTTLETATDGVEVVSAVYDHGALGETQELRQTERGPGFITTKIFVTDARGVTKSEVFNHSITSVD